MNKSTGRALLVLVSLTIPACAWARVQAVIVESGEMEIIATDVPLGPDFDEHSLGRGYEAAGSRFLNHDDSVPAELCRSFGFRAWVAGGPGDKMPARIVLDLHHPKMTRPDGASATETTLSLPVRQGQVSSAYTLDQPWEAVPGDWTFDLVLDGQVLASTTIVLTPPQTGQAAKVCPGKAVS